MSVTCIACDGKKTRGTQPGYVFPCPYCDGSGQLKDEEERLSVGYRIGKLFRHALQMELKLEIDKEGSFTNVKTNTNEHFVR